MSTYPHIESIGLEIVEIKFAAFGGLLTTCYVRADELEALLAKANAPVALSYDEWCARGGVDSERGYYSGYGAYLSKWRDDHGIPTDVNYEKYK
jgi:hypothetical protein